MTDLFEVPADTAAELAVVASVVWQGGKVMHDLHLSADDFYRPAHADLWSLLLGMQTRREPIDPTSVRSRLMVECPQHSALLLDVVTENRYGSLSVSHHARTVADKAVRRRLIASAQRIIQDAQGPAPADELVEAARRSVDGVLEHVRTGDDLPTFEQALSEAMESWEKPDSRTQPTGWVDLDAALTGGLRPGHLAIIGARPAVGKALALTTPLPTAGGWVTMGDIQVGDYLIGMDGLPTRVVAATEVMENRDCYEVTFSDGTRITADAQHEWLTSTRAARRAATPPGGYVFNRASPLSRDQRHKSAKPSIVTTETMASTATAGSRPNHAVEVAKAFALPELDLPIHPYVLGAWLGDGTSIRPQITSADPDLILDIEGCGYETKKLKALYLYAIRDLAGPLRSAGLIGNKHIPREYLRASERQRRDLLAGLLDTDGTVGTNGGVQFAVTSERLARDTLELILTLGYRATMTTKVVKGRRPDSSICYMVNFTTADKVFRLARKASKQTTRQPVTTMRRYVTSVCRVESVPVRCVQVDNEDHMYLASLACIPTHNSFCASVLSQAVASRGVGALVASLEMSRAEVVARVVANVSRVNLAELTASNISEDGWERIARDLPRMAEYPLWIDHAPHQTVQHITSRARSVKRRSEGLGVVVVDYLQLVRGERGVSRQEQVASVARGLKLLARDLDVPVVALAQVNRGPEHRGSKKSTMSDLRESGEIENSADEVILLHRDDDENPGVIEFDVQKNRHGRTGVIQLAWAPHMASIRTMAKGY